MNEKMNLKYPVLAGVIAFGIGMFTKIFWAVSFWPMVLFLVCGSILYSIWVHIELELTIRTFRKAMESEEFFGSQSCEHCNEDCNLAH
jgi:hypothetical protein